MAPLIPVRGGCMIDWKHSEKGWGEKKEREETRYFWDLVMTVSLDPKKTTVPDL